MYPVLLKLGPLTIYSYGTMMAIGFLAAGYLTSKEMDRRSLNGELASSLVFWAAVGGLVGVGVGQAGAVVEILGWTPPCGEIETIHDLAGVARVVIARACVPRERHQ
jgi:hypothetical protein